MEYDKKQKEILRLIYIPALIYFIIVSIASPWNVLRYTSPVCGLIFIFVMYYLYISLKILLGEKKSSILMLVTSVAILIAPIIYKIEPELVYKEKKEIVSRIEEEQNLNMLYIYNSDKSNFLDDILLFTKINESYIAKDLDYTEENIQKILEGKDIQDGLIIFVNEVDIENLEKIKEATNLKNVEYLEKLNSCDVYKIN